MSSPAGPYRTAKPRLEPLEFWPLALAAGALALFLVIAAAAYLLAGLPLGYSVMCGVFPLAVVTVVTGIGVLLGEHTRRQLWQRVAQRACPACGTTLGLAALYVPTTADTVVAVSHVGTITTARCATCGALSEWTPSATLYRPAAPTDQAG